MDKLYTKIYCFRYVIIEAYILHGSSLKELQSLYRVYTILFFTVPLLKRENINSWKNHQL